VVAFFLPSKEVSKSWCSEDLAVVWPYDADHLLELATGL
jgi:hypothetical protein